MTTQQFNLPDVGEGLTEAEIVTWKVSVGDTVSVNQVIVEIETAKSLVELPSPHAGTVDQILVDEGNTVPVGTPLIAIRTAGDATPEPHLAADATASAEDPAPEMLVGYGAREPKRRHGRRRNQPAPGPDPQAAIGEEQTPATAPAAKLPPEQPKAAPAVRKLAKTLGVNLHHVQPSSADGIITRRDILDAAKSRTNGTEPDSADTAAAGHRRLPVRGVRKHMATAMSSSAFTAPHVTEFMTVDITATIDLRDQLASTPQLRDIKVSALPFVAYAFVRALQRTPAGNATWDDTTQEIIEHDDINLGIAAATPRGLVVPNIKHAQRLTFTQLAAAVSRLTTVAREGKTSPEEMAHGTATITNVGVFGVDSGTPILNPGETVILAVGAINRRPWVIDIDGSEQLAPRWVTQLALSFDHRVLDGQQGSQILADTARALHQPGFNLL